MTDGLDASLSSEAHGHAIGVPLGGSALSGVDALYAIVQMPPGIPVASVAIGGARNAGVLAAQILALADPAIAKALDAYKKKLADKVEQADEKLRTARAQIE